VHWNNGGWFGSQIGGTAWILIAGILSAFKDIDTGLIVLAVFAVPNIIGLFLWRNRNSISCYQATQLLIPLMGGFGILAVYMLDKRGLWYVIQSGGIVSANTMYLMLMIVVLALMLMFYFRAGRNSD